MGAFWAGTVPLMLGLGLGLQKTIGPAARRLHAASATVVLVLGLLSIAGKVSAPSMLSENAHAADVGDRR
jgi:sulfite exporter TauE/SafE